MNIYRTKNVLLLQLTVTKKYEKYKSQINY